MCIVVHLFLFFLLLSFCLYNRFWTSLHIDLSILVIHITLIFVDYGTSISCLFLQLTVSQVTYKIPTDYINIIIIIDDDDDDDDDDEWWW